MAWIALKSSSHWILASESPFSLNQLIHHAYVKLTFCKNSLHTRGTHLPRIPLCYWINGLQHPIYHSVSQSRSSLYSFKVQQCHFEDGLTFLTFLALKWKFRTSQHAPHFPTIQASSTCTTSVLLVLSTPTPFICVSYLAQAINIQDLYSQLLQRIWPVRPIKCSNTFI